MKKKEKIIRDKMKQITSVIGFVKSCNYAILLSVALKIKNGYYKGLSEEAQADDEKFSKLLEANCKKIDELQKEYDKYKSQLV